MLEAGFTLVPGGKGSQRKFEHPAVRIPAIIPGRDGDDAKAYLDDLKDSILETLRDGWRERLVAIPDCPAALALESNDLAAVKLLVGRPKDLSLVRLLHDTGRITAGTVHERIEALPIPVELKPRLLANFRSTMG